MVHGSLYHDPGRDDGALQWIVPRCVRKELLWALHNSPYSGHLGEGKTLGRLRERYYWPGHYNVTNWCCACESCARRKMSTPRRHAPLGTIGAGSPMQVIATDILGPLLESAKKNRYILVAGDYFMHWMEAYARILESSREGKRNSMTSVSMGLHYKKEMLFGYTHQLHQEWFQENYTALGLVPSEYPRSSLM